ncbi:MAG: MFS transporter small subunit [Chthoniobacterales bacterium]
MNEESGASGNGPMLLVSWVVVGVPLIWGVYNTLLKLPALFH